MIKIFTICLLFASVCMASPKKMETNTNAIKSIGITLTPIDVIQQPASIIEYKTPDASKSISSAKSFTEQQAELKKDDKKKKPIKYRTQIIDGRTCSWGRTPEEAYMSASAQVLRLVDKKEYQIKDAIFVADGPKCICTVRYNYKDSIPETWCLETEMVTGFGKSKEKAYIAAYTEALAKVKRYQNNSSFNSNTDDAKLISESGVIIYDYVFSNIGKEFYCKIFFRYFMPRK